jgi:hypothetical protein
MRPVPFFERVAAPAVAVACVAGLAGVRCYSGVTGAMAGDAGVPDATVGQDAGGDATTAVPDSTMVVSDVHVGGSDAGSTEDAGHDADAGVDSGPPGVNLFVASGYQNRRIVSEDGITWVHDTVDPPNSLDDIGSGLAIGLGIIVVAGDTGIYTSPDGKAWNHLAPPVPQVWPGLGGCAATFGDGKFVIVNGSDSWISTDGALFVNHSPDGGTVGATHWGGIAYGNNVFFAVGDSNGPGDRKVSPDGINWSGYVQDSIPWSGVAFGQGVFVAVGSSGRRAWTTDGITINDVSDTTLGDIGGVAFGGGKFIASGTNFTATSGDGKTWTTSPAGPASKLSFGGGLFLTTTWMSNVLTSPNGQTPWKNVFSGDAGSPALSRVTWGLVGGY